MFDDKIAYIGSGSSVSGEVQAKQRKVYPMLRRVWRRQKLERAKGYWTFLKVMAKQKIKKENKIMAIEMIPNSRMGQETAALKADTGLKEGVPEKEGEAVKLNESGKIGEGGKGNALAVTERVKAAGETVRVSQTADIGQVAESGKDGKMGGATVRRRTLDQYIPEEKAESFGHYEVVPDENGNSKIQFDRPDTSSGEKAKGEQTKDSPAEEGAVKKAGSRTEGAGSQSQKIQKLKLKKKQLKEQIKAETDPKKAGELKRKLAKVEKELKGKGGLNF